MTRTAFIDIGDPGAPVGSPSWCKYAHGILCSSKRRTDSEVRGLKYSLIEFRDLERWKQLTDKKGEPFRSWEDYLQYPEPDGLGMSPASAKLVIDELDDSRLLGDVLGEHGGAREGAGRPKKGESREPGNQVDNINLNSKGGTARAYILARLERDGHHDLADKVRAGELSANAAAIVVGYRKASTPLERVFKLLLKLTPTERRQLRARLDEMLKIHEHAA